MRVGYLHLIGGASGDMLLGAIIDAGLPLAELESELTKLPITGYHLEANPAIRRGLHGTHLQVQISPTAPAMIWRDFRSLVNTSRLSPHIKQKALEVFGRLEKAETRAHRRTDETHDPHLDELGTLDTLIDVVGAIVGFNRLGLQKLYASPLPTGSGLSHSAHGPLPAAAPATMEIIAMSRASVTAPSPNITGELVTPTGAAIITTMAEFQEPALRLERIGYGLGTRDPEGIPNGLALWVGEQENNGNDDTVLLLETNIDDMNPQIFGYVQERLLALGAMDVWFTSIQMKKNRPGSLLSVLLPLKLEELAVTLLLKETSTLGVRRRKIERHVARRETRQIETSLGSLPVKIKYLEDYPIAVVPEYEACRELAFTKGLALQQVLWQVEHEARHQILGE